MINCGIIETTDERQVTYHDAGGVPFIQPMHFDGVR